METTGPLTFKDGNLDLNALECTCGRRHEPPFRRVTVRADALTGLPGVLAMLSGGQASRRGHCCIVADPNTFDAAGRRVQELLAADGWTVTVSLIGTREAVIPDETSTGLVALDMDADTRFLVSVGSGCVTDVTRFVAARTGTSFVSVPTAPSVDAYTSNNCPMTHRGVKRTLAGVPANAVVADSKVLAAAPPDMVASGFGDTIAKLVSRCDWQLSGLITGGYYCPEIDRIVTAGATRCTGAAKDIGKRDAQAVSALAESLMVSGAAMAILEDSRPASGAEHALSHFWEMQAAYRGTEPHLHGTKVGVGTVVMAVFWERFRKRLESAEPDSIDAARISNRPGAEAIHTALLSALGPAADMLFRQVTVPRLTAEPRADARLEALRGSLDQAVAVAAQVPDAGTLVAWLHEAGGPATPEEIGVNADGLREALLCGLEVRNRYTVLTAAEDLGWLQGITDEVVDFF